MADIESNIDININADRALASIKRLQAEISAFHQSMAKGGAKAAQESALMQQQLVNSINATGKFAASMQTVQTSTESFTESLEKNKFSLGQYFRYGASQVSGFRKIFSSEFDTIEKVARERVKTLQTQYIKLGRDANGAMKSIAVRPLSLDMEDLGTKTAIAAQKAQIFNQVLKQGSTNLLNFGKNTQWAGRQLMVGFTIPLSIFGATAAKEFMKLEEQAIRFKRVYGETFTPPEEADKMIGQIRQLGEEYTKYGVAIDKTMGLAADAAAMGKQGADLLKQVAQASNLAVLGGVDQKQALETTISLTNTFGVAADKLAGKINFLNAVENQTVTSIEDLTTAIPIAAPVIQQLGGDVEDLTFFLTAMKEGGIDAGEGANALKSGLASMINPTQEAKDQLAGFGINIEAIRDANAGDVAGMVRSLATELSGLSDLQRAQSIETMFGKFQFSRMSTLFQNVIAEGTQASRVLKLTQATTEELAVLSERELKRVEDSPMYQFQGAVERFQAALAPVGESFVKAVTPIINFGTEILTKFNDMGDGAKQFWTVLVAAVAGLGPVLLMTFGLMANGLANVLKLFGMMRGGFLGLAGDSNTLGEQTQYMSQEQLEAAAVAASLNQVHSNLIQTFTSEKSAVRALSNAYREAAIAIQGVQRPMMPGAPAAGATKKYASGIFSVPGPKGAGDVVPAMLSPGESVIPADASKKYAPLIQGMIDDKIPGYVSGLNGSQASHIWPSLDVNDPNVMSQMEQYIPGFSSMSEQQRKSYDPLGNLTMDMPDWMNQGMRAHTSGISSDAFSQGYNSVSGKLANTAQASGIDVQGDEILRNIVQDIEDQIGAEAVKLAAGGPIKDEHIAQAAKAIVNRAVESTDKQIADVGAKLKARAGTLGSFGGKTLAGTGTGQEELDKLIAAGEAKYVRGSQGGVKAVRINPDGTEGVRLAYPGYSPTKKDPQKRADQEAAMQAWADSGFEGAPPVAMRGSRVSRGTIKGSTYENQKDIGLVKANEEGVAEAKEKQKAYQEELKKAPKKDLYTVNRDRNSPHEQVSKDAADDVAEYQRIADKEAAKSSGVTAGPGALPKPTRRKAAKLVTGEDAMDNVTAARNNAMLESGALVSSNTSPVAEKIVGKLGSGLDWLRGKSPKLAGVIDRKLEDLDRALDLNGKYQAEEEAVQQRALVAQEKLAAAYEAEATRMAREGIDGPVNIDRRAIVGDQGIADLQAQQDLVDRENAKSKKIEARRNRQRVAGSIGMTASMAVGMASMVGGPVGEFAQSIAPMTMGFSVLAPLIAGLPAPVALAATAIAALGAGVFVTVDAMNKAREEALKFAEATGAGTKSIEKLAEFAGTVTAGQEMREKRKNNMQGFAVQTGKDSFGANYVKSEPGKEMIDGINKYIKSNPGDLKTVQSNIINQMSTAVATGALSADQARSIVAELGQELGDVNFGIRVNAELLEILGPNGENILKDPVGIRLKIMEDSQKMMDTQKGIMQSKLPGSQLTAAGGMALGGVGTGVAIGGIVAAAPALASAASALSAAGIAATGLGPALGTAAAAAVGVAGPIGLAVVGVGALAGGIYLAAKGMADMDKSTAAFTASGIIAIQQQQEMLDSLQKQYEQRVAMAKAAGDTAEAERLTTEYINGRKDIIASGAQAKSTMLDTYMSADQTTRGSMGRSLDDALSKMYADNPLMQSIANEAQKQVVEKTSNTSEGQALEYQLKLSLADTNVDPQQILNLVSNFSEGDGVMEGYIAVSTSLGSADGNRALQLMSMFVDKDGNPIKESQTKFMAKLETMDQDQATKYLDMFTEVSKVEGVKQLSYVMDVMLKNPEAGYRALDQINKIKAIEGDGPITVTMVQELIGGEVGDIVAQNQAYFDSLDKNQQVVYTQTLLTIYETRGTPEYKGQLANWLQETGNAKKWNKDGKIDATERQLMNEFDAAQAYKVTESTPKTATSPVTADTSPSSGGGGGGRQSSVLDDLLQKLRRVQMATLGLTEGWKGAREALDGLFPGGGSNSPFEGIEQQMRRLGAKEDLITMIAGMDPEEFQKRKNELFTFDGAGNIVGFRNSLLSIGAAMRSIAFGDFQNQQQKNINVIRDQNIAIQKLIGLGYSMAEAYKIVENEALASAIAQETNSEIIKKSAEDYKEATKQAKLFAAAQAAATANQTTQSKADTIAWLKTNSAGLSNAVINEMLNNQEFATLMMSPTLTQTQSDALNTWIANVENAANLEIEANIVPGNRDGMIKVFEDGFSKAMETFSVKEKEIELRFKVQKDPFIQTAEAAANMIDDIQNRSGGLDDLQAELDRMSYKEEDINKKYQERMDALDKIKQINDQISAQQKSQLSVADALSQGDIAGAARAAQEARAQAAERALSNEQKMLEQAKQNEINALTAQNGMTREQIEARVRDLKLQVLNIEETMLEPAQRALTLLERQEKKERESLTVLGRTRAEWETIKNNIDLAKVNSKLYKDAIELALTVVDDIVEAWKEIEKPKTTVHTIVTNYVSGSGGAGNIGASGDGSGGGSNNGSNSSTPVTSDPYPAATYGTLTNSAIRSRYSRFKGGGPSGLQGTGASLWNSWLRAEEKSPGGSASMAAMASLGKLMKSVGFNSGGLVAGMGDKDTIRAMLTPGEFVIRKSAVEAYGASTMKDINNGTFQSGSVYNYSVNLNVKSESDADTIANVVIKKIQGIEDKRIRGNRF